MTVFDLDAIALWQKKLHIDNHQYTCDTDDNPKKEQQ